MRELCIEFVESKFGVHASEAEQTTNTELKS